MDIKIAADPGALLVRSERRDHARDVHQPREASPGVIVELGRQAPELPGTYSARGVLEGAPPPPKAGVAPPPGTPPATTERVQAEAPPVAPAPVNVPEALRVPANVQVQTLATASPQVAVALRGGLPHEAPHLHPPPPGLTAGIQPLAPTALKQAEKGNAAAEHEEEADVLRKDKDDPRGGGGRRRAR